MISVIVPIYNSEKYLKKCLESIINQTYKDLEIILVNDGSTDNSGKICDEYAKNDKRIKVIYQQNGGQATARNAGLKVAQGEYIAFVDSDDYVEKDIYEIMLSMMEKSQSDIAICGHKEVLEDENSSGINFDKNEVLDTKALWQEVFGRLNNAVWNKLFRRELIGELSFPIGMIHGEDLLFNLNYLKNCKSGVITRSEKYFYVQRVGSITKSGFSEKKFTEIKSKDLAFEIVAKNHPAQLETAKKYCFRARMNLIRAISKSSKENEYIEKIAEFKEYINTNYKIVKKVISTKEKVEYYLFNNFYFAYKLLVKMIF